MKKLMVAVMFVLATGTAVSAQDFKPGMQKQITSEQRAKMMASRLMLDDKTSAEFVPLYEEYVNKLSECRPERRQRGEGQGLSDKEIDEQLKARFDRQEKRLYIQREYYDKFKEVLTIRQVKQLYDQPNLARKFPSRTPKAQRR